MRWRRPWRRSSSSPPSRCRGRSCWSCSRRRSARRRPRPWRRCSPATRTRRRGGACWWRTWPGACAWRPGPEVVGWLRRFFDVSGGNKLSMAALETLAIIAYRQPMTGPEIQELRGVSAAGVLKTLLERRLVRIVGRKEVVGKPFLYGTTREFLVHFGLNSLKDLPPLEEFEETFGSRRRQRGGRPRRAGGAAAAASTRPSPRPARTARSSSCARSPSSEERQDASCRGGAHERRAPAEDPGPRRHRLPPQGRGDDRGGTGHRQRQGRRAGRQGRPGAGLHQGRRQAGAAGLPRAPLSPAQQAQEGDVHPLRPGRAEDRPRLHAAGDAQGAGARGPPRLQHRGAAAADRRRRVRAARSPTPATAAPRPTRSRSRGPPPRPSSTACATASCWRGRRTAPAKITARDFRPAPRRRGEPESDNSWWVVEIAEGRTRQIREMFFQIGHPVGKLRRVAIGPLRDPGCRSAPCAS